jgi:hypothetical protein
VHASRGELLGIHVLVREAGPQQAQLVVLVEDREVAGVPDPLGLAAQDAHAGRVEGAGPEQPGASADERLQALAHLTGGLVGEGDRQDGPRMDAPLVHEVGDPVGQDPRLSAARSGQHQQGAVAVEDRLALRGIEGGDEVFHDRMSLASEGGRPPAGTPGGPRRREVRCPRPG